MITEDLLRYLGYGIDLYLLHSKAWLGHLWRFGVLAWEVNSLPCASFIVLAGWWPSVLMFRELLINGNDIIHICHGTVYNVKWCTQLCEKWKCLNVSFIHAFQGEDFKFPLAPNFLIPKFEKDIINQPDTPTTLPKIKRNIFWGK